MTDFSLNFDPLRLEALDDAHTQAFAAAEQQKTRDFLAQCPDYAPMVEDMIALLQDERQIAFCEEHRAKMYHFYQNKDFPRGVYRVCSATSYRAGAPEWVILFSVADFDVLLGERVYLQGVDHCAEAPHRVLLSLSPDGGDKAYTVEFDLASQSVVQDGFHFPLGKNQITWRDEDSVWVCPAWEVAMCTQSGYANSAYLLRRSEDWEEAKQVAQAADDVVQVDAWRYLDGQGKAIDMVAIKVDFFRTHYYQVLPDDTLCPMRLPESTQIVGYLAGQLLVLLQEDWQRANRAFVSGSLLAVKWNKGQLGEAQCLFAPQEGQAIETVETTRSCVVATLLNQVQGELLAWRWDAGCWQVQPVPSLPKGALEIIDQPWGGDMLYLTSSDFLTPLTLFALDVAKGELSVMRRQKAQFVADGAEVAQYQAQAVDGTLIPYYRVAPKDAKQPPTLVYAYGGFGVAELPHYLGLIGRYWLARGGAFVLANIRGGGELGPKWHQAAKGAKNKPVGARDVLAVVRDLYRQGLAVPEHLAIQGGSNGGLVMAMVYAQAASEIGAMVCEVPLIDMLRYHQLGAGMSWLAEYGNPDDLDEIGYLKAYSPYHTIQASPQSPPVWLTTSLSDDRVHPSHALKLHALLRQAGAPSWLYLADGGGHTGAHEHTQTAADAAALFAFLWQAIGN